MSTSFPYLSDGNDSNLMDEFASLDYIDSNDLDVNCEDIATMEENDQQSLSANILASLLLPDDISMISPNVAEGPESINISDGLDRIVQSIFNNFS